MTELKDFDREFGATQSGQLDIRKLTKNQKVATRRSTNTHAVKKAIREEKS